MHGEPANAYASRTTPIVFFRQNPRVAFYPPKYRVVVGFTDETLFGRDRPLFPFRPSPFRTEIKKGQKYAVSVEYGGQYSTEIASFHRRPINPDCLF